MVRAKLKNSFSRLNVGFTAEWKFYNVHTFASPGINVMFYQDFQKMEISIPQPRDQLIIIAFDYDSLSFINVCHDNRATIGYKYPPKCYTALPKKNGKKGKRERVFQNIALVENIIQGSAINFIYKRDVWLDRMMTLFGLEVTDSFFPVLQSPIRMMPICSATSDCEAAIISLGFPGIYLLDYYRNSPKINDNVFLEQIYYHIRADRRLPEVKLQFYVQQKLDSNFFVLTKAAIVTPSQVILIPPTWKESSYGIRRLDPDKILSVDLRDDNLRQISSNEKKIIAGVIAKCVAGLTICGKTYNELFCSSSKFREHSSFFYHGTKPQILTILKSLGEFEPALPAKLGARIGLNSSSVRVGLVPESFVVVEDIKSSCGGYEFTDGCGQISQLFAVQMTTHLLLDHVPSAFQIRFPGFKGVLMVSDSETMDMHDVVFRKSQHKFRGNTGDATLDVITQSCPSTMCLSKAFIEVLCQNAAKWSTAYKERVEKRIMELAEMSILKLIDKCVDADKFQQTLNKLPNYLPREKMDSYTINELLGEPFLRGLVQSDSMMHLKNIYEKSKIQFPSHLGRQMIGVPDFDGYLRPGQVFVRYSVNVDATCDEFTVLTGAVAVTRSPQYNLSDIRFVEAVDVPQYNYLKDVIVFPITGSRPIQDEMAGGDLDGDEYSVFWDPDLMLPASQPAPQFSAPTPDPSLFATIDTIQEKYMEFRKEYMSTDPIGVYANNHSCLSEHFGFDDYTVMKLAEKLDVQVNYFKSGIAAAKIEKLERAQFYPEHMRKDHKPVYRLQNLLSKIHRLGEALFLDAKDVIKSDDKVPFIDPLIYIDGWDLYKDRAEKMYKAFKGQVDRIQIQHGVSNVIELFSGRITEFTYRISRYIHDKDPINSLLGLLRNNVSGLMKDYRHALLDLVGPRAVFPSFGDDLKKLAVACYRVAYADGVCLAFPWTLWDVIDAVRLDNKKRNKVDVSFETRILAGVNFGHNRYQRDGVYQMIGYVFEVADILWQILDHSKMSVDYNVCKKLVDAYINVNGVQLQASTELSYSPETRDAACMPTDVMNFFRHYGFVAYNDIIQNPTNLNFAEKCREMYLRIAFKKNPQLLKQDNTLELKRYFKISLQLECAIIKEAFLPNLEKKIGCKADIRKNKNMDGYVYCLVVHGSKKSIEMVKDLFIITSNERDTLSSSRDQKVARLTATVVDIQQCRGSTLPVNERFRTLLNDKTYMDNLFKNVMNG